MNIDSESLLLVSGAILLGVAAFMGFAQAKARGSHTESMWRVVHSGGTAGGVQLIALAAVWTLLGGQSPGGAVVAVCLCVSTWLFFIGPLLRVLERDKAGNLVLWIGATAAIPAYAGLIVLAVARFG